MATATVHSIAAARNHPQRLRRRFDLATISPVDAMGCFQSLQPKFFFGSVTFIPFEELGRVADNILRDTTLAWCEAWNRHLHFLRLFS